MKKNQSKISYIIHHKSYILHLTSYIFTFVIATYLLLSCNQPKTLFELQTSEQTGIDFINTVTEKDTVNIIDAEFVYNGGGVGVGDLNGDGFDDIYFAANQVENRLYLNKGKLKFEDVTLKSGAVKRNLGEWSSGVTMVDLNQDGKLDIYVSNTFSPKAVDRRNLLFINQGNDKDGIPKFRELAVEYGVASDSHSSHSAFLDYDKDGDLDLFVGVNYIDEVYPNQFKTLVEDGTAKNRDILLKNDWNDSLNHPVFTDVSLKAGILYDGYSHSSTVVDFNEDGWPDIYVANDYYSNDIIYINNQDGTFTNRVGELFKHLSNSAMGSDAADINNDGLMDLVTTEMLPTYNKRKKLLMGANSYQTIMMTKEFKYQLQYIRNTLQLNRGKNPNTGLPVFSDIAFMAGVQETDWSWSPLLADFDNDGLKDLIVTNGYPKDVTDQDFGTFRSGIESTLISKDQLYSMIPEIKLPNFAFKNKNGLEFKDVSKAWGIVQPSFSNGSAYSDFDKDGDLDLVINNIDDKAFLYKNTLNDNTSKEVVNPNFLRVKLIGDKANKTAVGSRVTIYHNNKIQLSEVLSARGYLSKSEDYLHFGLGKINKVDSVIVNWPDGKKSVQKNISTNQTIELKYADSQNPNKKTNKQKNSFLTQIPLADLGIEYTNKENDFIDFNVQKTLPHKLSQYGPGMAVGDINGDGLDDFILGGSARIEGFKFIQKSDGKFIKTELNFKTGFQKKEEDLGILLFDADNDGDNDLYITYGSGQHPLNSSLYQDKLYINDGKGDFKLDSLALPEMRSSKQTVRAIDYDRDGDLDLFVGSRVRAESYPEADRSYILRNDLKVESRESRVVSGESGVVSGRRSAHESGVQRPTSNVQRPTSKVKFTDVTAQVCPELMKIGMISDALWTDFDNDGWPDLMLAGEWMPIVILKNEGNDKNRKFVNRKSEIVNQKGWWNSLCGADFDNDGDIDYIAGNFGKNTYFQCNSDEPLTIYGKDFDQNGRYDAFISCFYKDSLGKRNEYFYHSRDDMVKQLITIRKKFERYADYGNATAAQVFSKGELKGATILKANYMQSAYIENLGNGNFKMTPLPLDAQMAPLHGMMPYDVDNDGLLDVLLVGNDYGMEVFQGQADAFYGLVLKNIGNGKFRPLSIEESGFYVPADARGLSKIRIKNQEVILAPQNRNELLAFKFNNTESKFIKLQPDDSYGIIELKNGKKRKVEFYYGSTFISQDSRQFKIPNEAIKITIFKLAGGVGRVIFSDQEIAEK